MDYDFADRLAFSAKRRDETDLRLLKRLIPGTARVDIAGRDMERLGVDYVAWLRAGAPVYVDAKARKAGESRWWGDEPDLALETWSVIPGPTSGGKVGWTLSESALTDLVLFTFDPGDSDLCYLVGFQPLRMAFELRREEWERRFKVAIQSSNGGQWCSEAVFVPASVVLNAVRDTCTAPVGGYDAWASPPSSESCSQYSSPP